MGRGDGTLECVLEAEAAPRGSTRAGSLAGGAAAAEAPPTAEAATEAPPTAEALRSNETPDELTRIGSLVKTAPSGERYRFELARETERIKEAWVVDEIEISDPAGEPIGYLKISYIPEDRFKKHYPTLLHWVCSETGEHFILGEKLREKPPQDQWGSDDYREMIAVAGASCRSVRYGFTGELENLQTLSEAELSELWSGVVETLVSGGRYEERFQQFREFHLDKPHVDFIRVYAEGEPRRRMGASRRADHRLPGLSESHQGRGLGAMLYKLGSLWMRERGMKLYASGIQSEQAQGAWASFQEAGLTLIDESDIKKRAYLNADKILRDQPELSLTG